MTDVLEEKVRKLPLQARQEASDYIDYLIYKYSVDIKVKPRAGFMKGIVTWMSNDFNEPLEDFNG